jgi:hypothetical protein
MTRELGDRDAPGGRSRRPGVVARRVAAPPGAAAGDREAQAERSEEPFALLRAAIERRERTEPAGRVGD